MRTMEEVAVETMMAKMVDGDSEANHQTADDILCEFLLELGYNQLVDAYLRVS